MSGQASTAVARAACLLPTPQWLQAIAGVLATAPRLVLFLQRATSAASPAWPFSFEERAAWLHAALPPELSQRVTLLPLREHYDAARDALAMEHALQVQAVHWHAHTLPAQLDAPAGEALEALYAAENPEGTLSGWRDRLGPAASRVLSGWIATPDFERVRGDWRQIAREAAIWSTVPYPVVKVTVDAVVRASSHVLLVRRGRHPGLGLWALPGGFLEPEEPVLDAALRELHEETGLPLPLDTLRAAVRGQQAFTHPQRSQRGRIVTFTVFVDLGEMPPPAVQGGDDAAAAHWVPIGQLPDLESRMHDDHFMMLDAFLGLLPHGLGPAHRVAPVQPGTLQACADSTTAP